MTAEQTLSTSHTEPVISLRNLRVSYGEREILHGISFDVVHGETLVILGGSGSGKSTLLRKLQQVGLEGFEYYTPAQLSGGMKKRAAVARALAMDPEILFFDEPSAGLDPIIAAGIDQLILRLKEAFHMTVIVVTHELASAFLIADRMVLIEKGNIIASGPPAEFQASTHPRVRQFLDRVAEPEIEDELDYLQLLTETLGSGRRPRGSKVR